MVKTEDHDRPVALICGAEGVGKKILMQRLLGHTTPLSPNWVLLRLHLCPNPNPVPVPVSGVVCAADFCSWSCICIYIYFSSCGIDVMLCRKFYSHTIPPLSPYTYMYMAAMINPRVQ